MEDRELYRHLLGISAPWSVSKVELDLKGQRVDVWTEHSDTSWPCPECNELLPVYDHADERQWRHLDSCQFATYLRAKPPRVKCPTHGVKQVRLLWAEPRSRFTAMFERFAIDVLLQTDITGARRILRISWDEAWHILKRAVGRGLAAKESRICSHVGVDEKAIAKNHKYMTLVCDLKRGTIEHIAKDRRCESLDGYFKQLSPEQLAGIEAIAVDMWDPFVKAIRLNVPGWEEKLVFDRFHVMKQVGWAVDLVRKKEHKELRSVGDETLKGSKYLWLYAKENVPDSHLLHFQALRTANLKTARAWAIKESLRELWHYKRRGWAMKHWKRWYGWASHSKLKPVIYAARTLQRHLQGVMTYFAHPVTNAVSEGINSKIQTIKKRAYGFRNPDNFEAAIFFHCGGLQLYPVTH
jgi:transposase